LSKIKGPFTLSLNYGHLNSCSINDFYIDPSDQGGYLATKLPGNGSKDYIYP